MFQFTDTKTLSEDGAWIHLKDADRPAYLVGDGGKPNLDAPIRIKVFGPDSETAKDRARKRAARLLKQRGSETDFTKMSVTEIEARIGEGEEFEPDIWADRVIAWENMPGFDGGTMEFTHENAKALFTRFPAILEQIKEEAADRSDFLALLSTD